MLEEMIPIADSAHRIIELASRRVEQVCQEQAYRQRPFTTLTYAQSIDGSIAALPSQTLQLSNPQSLAMTHGLRACHDAILVGINTVLIDDPRLTVRLVPGKNPQPIVLDSALRFPLHAQLLREPCLPPLIVTALHACPRNEAVLRSFGASVLRVPVCSNGLLNLAVALKRIKSLGFASLMVEGGARVITSFLSAGLADQVVLTISPQFVGGLRGVKRTRKWARRPRPRLTDVLYESLGGDLVVFGSLRTDAAQTGNAELSCPQQAGRGQRE